MNKDKQELKEMSLEKLQEKLGELRRELFSLRLNSATAHIKDYSQFKKLKKAIARVLTYLRQRIVQIEQKV